MYRKIHIPLADAVTADLNDKISRGVFNESLGSDFFPPGFEARRLNLAIDELDKANELTVIVFPGSRTTNEEFRTESQRSHRVVIAIMEKIETAGDHEEQQAREDRLIGSGEVIEQAMERTGFDLDGVHVQWEGSDSDLSGSLPFLPDPLFKDKQFTTIVALRYTGVY